MKILWFANTPCSAVEKLGSSTTGGGWLVALERAIKDLPDIDLHIAFYYGEHLEPFLLNGVCYHPVYRAGTGSKMGRYVRRLTGRGVNDNKDIPRLVAVIDRVKPDLIHVHGTEENFGMVQQLTPVPVVISLQGIISACALKYFAGIPGSVAKRHERILSKIRLKTAGYVYQKLLNNAAREKVMLKPAKYVLGRTDWDRRVSRILAPLSKYYVGNEMLREVFYEHMWSKPAVQGILKIVTVSSDSLSKGFETIVATAEILSRLPAFPFEWTVVGLTEGSTIVQTVRSWKTGKYSNRGVKLAGLKTGAGIVDLFLTSDIYCQVSHIENSPNSVCEAMLVGMPVIASLAGGTGSMLTDGEEGILIQDGDPYVLAGAIVELATNHERGVRLGRQARKRALARHNAREIADNLLSVYKEVFKSHWYTKVIVM